VDSNIKALQLLLNDAGFDPGPIDGISGKRTSSAVSAYLATRVDASTTAKPVSNSKIFQGSSRTLVQEIIVHCSATRPDWMGNRTIDDQVNEIRRWHIEDNHWSDIGYHWIISRLGELRPGRLETTVGAHVEGHNTGTIGICLIGGHGSAKTDRAEQHFTDVQLEALRRLIELISERTPITKVSGHNQYAAKACPGFYVPSWFKGV
jgi:hypothetical protein